MWLWLRPAAIASIGPLAWEALYAVGAALKSKKKKGIVIVVLICVSPITSGVEHPFMCFVAVCVSSSEKCISLYLFTFRAAPVAHGGSQARG